MIKLPLIEKIHLLESRLNNNWVYPILEPFKFDSSNPIEVQNAGKKIAKHLGLPQFIFIISYAQQNPNIGGHINLDYSKDVFIEIDDKFKYDFEIVSAILAHEVCHKFLQINNLKLFPEFENEMLTDAATIYTGLGKLSLNGCEKTNIYTSRMDNVSTTTTTTNKIGYMNRKQFAFVYRLFCEMNRIPGYNVIQGLTTEAIAEVKSISDIEKYYFNEKYFSNTAAIDEVSKAFKDEFEETQKSFARLKRYIRIINKNILPAADKLYTDFHSFSKTKKDSLLSSLHHTAQKESFNYIKNLIALEELTILRNKILEKELEIKKMTDSFQKLITFINNNYSEKFSKQDLEFLHRFECPICNNQLRIDQKVIARVSCSKCNYTFIIDTGAAEPTRIDFKEQRVIKQKGLWFKIKSLFNVK